MPPVRVLRTAMAIVFAVLVSGCAAEVRRDHAELERVPPPAAKHYLLTSAASFRLATGFSRMLGGGTELLEVGSIAQGQVLRPVNTVLTVEGANVHEAYLVIRDQRAVGFYLPVEQAYSLLPEATPLSIEERSR